LRARLQVRRQLAAAGLELRRPPASRKEAEARWQHNSRCAICRHAFSSLGRWRY
jgi:hypothetical protein